jgi:hypothetical protein
MSTGRNRRLPISCEPCRVRKIRCPRDATPCGSCRRRGVSAAACQYAKRTPVMRPRSPPQSTVQELPSPLTDTRSLDMPSSENADLASRVRKLEQLLLLTVSPSTNLAADAGNNGAGGSWTNLSNNMSSEAVASPRDRLLGTLRTTEAGHLRYFPQALSWTSDLDDLDNECQGSAMASQPSRPLSTFNLSLRYSTYSMIQPFADNMHSSWKILIQCHFRGSLCFIQYYRQQFWHFLLTVLFCPILVGERRRWHGLLSSHNTIETCRCSRWKQTTSCGTIM